MQSFNFIRCEQFIHNIMEHNMVFRYFDWFSMRLADNDNNNSLLIIN